MRAGFEFLIGRGEGGNWARRVEWVLGKNGNFRARGSFGDDYGARRGS